MRRFDHLTAVVAFSALVGCQVELPETAMRPQPENAIVLDSAILTSKRRFAALLDSAATHPNSVSSKEKEVARHLLVASFLEAQSLLAELGYGIQPSGENDAATRAAVALFERRHSLTVTGNALSPTFLTAREQVVREIARARGPDPPLFTFFVDQWMHDVMLRGTWFPLSFDQEWTEILCRRAEAICEEQRVTASSGRWNWLHSKEVFRVTRWDANEIVASMDWLGCTRDELHVNRASETATLIASNIGLRANCDSTSATRPWRWWRRADVEVFTLRDGAVVFDSMRIATARKYALLPRAITYLLDSVTQDRRVR